VSRPHPNARICGSGISPLGMPVLIFRALLALLLAVLDLGA